MTKLDLKPITDWLGFKPGDLLQTKEPVWLYREYWDGPDEPEYNIKTEMPGDIDNYLGTNANLDDSLENKSFQAMRLEADHPWVLKAEENGWQTAPNDVSAYSEASCAPLEKFHALVVRFDIGKYDDLIIETVIEGETVYLLPLVDLSDDKDQVDEKLKAWAWQPA